MRFSLLTVSDSSSLNNSLDKSGPLLSELITKSQKLEKITHFGTVVITDRSIVPDEQILIENYLKERAQECDVILTIGGTGVSARDVTPEATKQVIERECNGISVALIVRGLQSTPMAALTRLTAGTYGKCLIINLPGSPKAVAESFEVLENILGHAVSLIQGNITDVGKVHCEVHSGKM